MAFKLKCFSKVLILQHFIAKKSQEHQKQPLNKKKLYLKKEAELIWIKECREYQSRSLRGRSKKWQEGKGDLEKSPTKAQKFYLFTETETAILRKSDMVTATTKLEHRKNILKYPSMVEKALKLICRSKFTSIKALN